VSHSNHRVICCFETLLLNSRTINSFLGCGWNRPICRTVSDAVYVLDAIVGIDYHDHATQEAAKYIPHGGYKQFLKRHALKGKRLGIVRNPFLSSASESESQAFEHHLQTLR
jgi:amidase